MTERDFWVQVRRGLLVIIDAIGTYYHLPRSADLGLNHNHRVAARPNGVVPEYEPPHTALARESNSTKENG